MVAAMLWMLVSIWNTPPTTLGEASIREAVRRQRVAPATRMINDQTLGPMPVEPPAPPVDPVTANPDVVPPPASAAAAGAAGGEAAAAKAETKDDKEEVKDAAWWGKRMTTARDALTRDRLLVSALESRVAALASDIAARDDPAQRTVLMNDRVAALAELDRMKKQVDADVAAIAAIQEEARKAGVPPGWVR